MRRGSARTPRRAAMRALVSSAACAFSTDSRKESSCTSRRGMFRRRRCTAGGVLGAEAEAAVVEEGGGGTSRGNWCVPCPRTATNSAPVSREFALASSGVLVFAPLLWCDGGDGDGVEGRFGQPMTPSSTRASISSARQTAYCPPRKNPFVPSIGSSVHMPVR
jgi:hypothetical protein